MQETDAERRLAILRGEVPLPSTPADNNIEDNATEYRAHGSQGRERKKRKHSGEDDTDFELRIAKERTEVTAASLDSSRKPTSDAPIVGRDGHIDLFGDAKSCGRAEKNDEAEKEKAEKRRELEDQYTMRFSNAAGKGGLERPWYAKHDEMGGLTQLDVPGKDAWGNEDAGRKKRDAQRMGVGDPLALMKKGAAKVRDLTKERKRLNKERERQVKELRKEERRHEKRRRRDGEDRGQRDRGRNRIHAHSESDSRRHRHRHPETDVERHSRQNDDRS
jgi:hypothetical protein